MRVYAAALAGLVLSGCAGVSYIGENFGSQDKQEIAMPDDTYWVFDKPGEMRMAISSSPGAAFATGTAQMMTLYTVNANPEAAKFEAAAAAFLEKSGRPECKPTASQFIVTPYYEVRYECVTAQPAPTSKVVRPRR